MDFRETLWKIFTNQVNPPCTGTMRSTPKYEFLNNLADSWSVVNDACEIPEIGLVFDPHLPEDVWTSHIIPISESHRTCSDRLDISDRVKLSRNSVEEFWGEHDRHCSFGITRVDAVGKRLNPRMNTVSEYSRLHTLL